MVKVKRTIDDYKDMIDLPHHISKKHAQMSTSNRAAQFAPFSAVVGHDSAIEETARYTDRRRELDEMEKVIIDEKLRKINSWLPSEHEIEIIYFEPDALKKGGRYLSKIGAVKKIDAYSREVVFADGKRIAVEEIFGIEV